MQDDEKKVKKVVGQMTSSAFRRALEEDVKELPRLTKEELRRVDELLEELEKVITGRMAFSFVGVYADDEDEPHTVDMTYGSTSVLAYAIASTAQRKDDYATLQLLAGALIEMLTGRGFETRVLNAADKYSNLGNA